MKVDRHAKIVELIGKYEIETQEELAEYLTKAGYQVTQATVSRDIRELKLSKVQAESGKQRRGPLLSGWNEESGQCGSKRSARARLSTALRVAKSVSSSWRSS